MKIVFRTDSSDQIGVGHLSRCLSLANTLRERGAECTFVCRDDPGNRSDLVCRNGFDLMLLPPQPDQGTDLSNDKYHSRAGVSELADASETCSILNEPVDWLVVDHYALGKTWESALRDTASRILVIDDLANRAHDCDLLLDQNLVANPDSRYIDLVPEHCGQLLGPHFAMMGLEYVQLRNAARIRMGIPQRILIYFGGADTDNLTGLALEACLSLPVDKIVFDVVISPDHPNYVELAAMADRNDSIELHENLPSLAPLLHAADLAIGAGGTSSWERCCLGLPSVVITLAENQEAPTSELDRQGLIRWLGPKEAVSKANIAETVAQLLAQGLDRDWSERCKALVDGRGAGRVADYLLLSADTRLYPRPAVATDEALLLEWANDATTRRNGFSGRRIDPATHAQWFRKRLNDTENCRFFIMETESGLPLGQVRFERDYGGWELHYAIDPRARGRRLGKVLVNSAIKALRAECDKPLRLTAKVKRGNALSSRVLSGAGFTIIKETEQIIEYENDAVS